MFNHEELDRLIAERGWTSRQVAERAGISQTAVVQYRTGKREPSVTALVKLSKAFGIPERFLIKS